MCFLLSIFLCFALVPKLVLRTVDFHWYWYRILKFWYRDNPNWNHVLWSDETKINLFGSDGVKRVWRQPGEEYKDKCVLPTAIMVVGVSWSGAA